MSVDVYPSPNIASAASVLAYVAAVNTQAGIDATEIAIAGYAATCFVPASRTVKVTVKGHIYKAAAGDGNESVVIRIKQDGVIVGGGQISNTAISSVHSTVYEVDAVIPSPTVGSHAYTVTIARSGGTATLVHRTRAAPDNEIGFILVEDITGGSGGPGPISLGYAEVKTNQGSIGATLVDLTGLTVTVNVPAGRRIRITSRAYFTSTTSDGDAHVGIFEGAFQLTESRGFVGGTTQPFAAEPAIILSPSAGTHTYKLAAKRVTGTGTLTNNAWDNGPCYILVEDITGTEAPTGAYYEALWTPVTAFLNGWVNHSAAYPPASYRKVNDLLYVRGLIKNGTVTNATAVFQLPVGYRPLYTHHIPAVSNDVSTFCRVQSDGYVTIGANVSAAWFSLDGVVAGLT